jgi:hypothetical protein
VGQKKVLGFGSGGMEGWRKTHDDSIPHSPDGVVRYTVEDAERTAVIPIF